MKKIIFSLAFLVIMLALHANESNAQSFIPFSFLKNTVPFVRVNDISEESSKDSDEAGSEGEKKVRSEVAPVENTGKSSPIEKSANSRITIDLGKALFEKYIK